MLLGQFQLYIEQYTKRNNEQNALTVAMAALSHMSWAGRYFRRKVISFYPSISPHRQLRLKIALVGPKEQTETTKQNT